MLIAVAAGVHIHTGLLGVFFIVVISGMFGMALAGINTMIALYTRNTEATFLLGNFVNLPLMFTSTAMMPKSFLPDWMQKIVVINPITYGIEGMRGLITTGFDPNKVFPAVIILGSIAAVSIIGATLMFRRRVA